MVAAGVLIPGTLCDARVFGPLADRLNLKPVFAAPIAHADVREAAAALLETAPARFVAIGFSLGGFVVLELMREAPERLLGAVLIASNGHALQAGAEDARRGEVASARLRGTDAVIEQLWPRYVARSRLDDAGLKTLVLDMARDVGADLFAHQAELAISRPDSQETVRRTRVPLLSLIGTEDQMSPPARARSLAEAPGSTLIELPESGHFVPLEAPEAVAGAINAWVEELALCC